MSGEYHKVQTRASESQLQARESLLRLFDACPIPTDQMVTNLGLFLRSSVLAKFLYVNELYEMIVRTPGVIMELGVWWGQNLALFESLRAVYEPYNFGRRVVGFDTFTGYPSIAPQDGRHELAEVHGYAVTQDYEKYLDELLRYHEQENPMPHICKYELVKGDASATVPEYLEAHPETIIALAYFDLQLYEPTKECLKAIKPHLTRGSVVALDELNSPEFPGETIAFKETWGPSNVRLCRSRYLPDRCYFVVE